MGYMMLSLAIAWHFLWWSQTCWLCLVLVDTWDGVGSIRIEYCFPCEWWNEGTTLGWEIEIGESETWGGEDNKWEIGGMGKILR